MKTPLIALSASWGTDVRGVIVKTVVLLLLLTLTACTRDTVPGDVTEVTKTDIPVLSELFAGYTVVVENSGDCTDAGYAFTVKLGEKTGVKIEFAREGSFAGGKAIYVGNTALVEKEGTAINSGYDYIIISQGEDIVISAGSNATVLTALNEFLALIDTPECLTALSGHSLRHIYNEEMLVLTRDGISFYTIVTPQGREWSELADNLAYKIKKVTGVRPEVVSEDKFDGRSGAIYFGNTQSAKSVGLRPLDYSISANGNDIIVAAGTTDSATAAAERFAEEIENNGGGYPSSVEIKELYSYADGEYEASVITNELPASGRTTLSAVTAMIYEPAGERYYNHDTYLCFSGGRLFAGWSSGYADENAPGQRVVYSVSDNGGADWSTPRPIAETKMGAASELVYNFRGFYDSPQGLIAYFSAFEYDISVLRGGVTRPEKDIGRGKYTMYYAVYSGNGWSEPTEIPVTDVFRVTGTALESGRLLFSGHNTFTITDNLSGINDFKSFTVNLSDAVQRGAEVLWEASYFTSPNGVISMMMRSNTNKLWCAISRDNGVSFSGAYPTSFTDDNAKVQFGNLPDGRAYCVGCPDANKKRAPLVLSVSEDGMTFDRQYTLGVTTTYRQQKDGIYKTGIFSYPAAVCDGENIYVVYSLYKEAVQIMIIPLESVK